MSDLSRNHDAGVVARFDPQAQAYLASAVHASGPDLRCARELVAKSGAVQPVMLDVGCGAGHLAFTLAPFFEQVLATDLSAAMLQTVWAAASDRGLAQISVHQASAGSLPFAASQFDLVASRYSAHHWQDLPAAMRELRRVMKHGGALLMIDILGAEAPLIDTHLQAIELLRDTSHVRNHSASQWRAYLAQAGFVVAEERSWPTRLEFRSWIERMHTPPEVAAVIRNLLTTASSEVRAALQVEADGSFVAHTGLFLARAAAD